MRSWDPQALRREISADEKNEDRNHDGRREECSEEQPREHAGGVHDDDFGIAGELVEYVSDRKHECHGGDHQYQLRDDKTRDRNERQDRLALTGHDVDVAQGVADPDDGGQARKYDAERSERRAKDIASNGSHAEL